MSVSTNPTLVSQAIEGLPLAPIGVKFIRDLLLTGFLTGQIRQYVERGEDPPLKEIIKDFNESFQLKGTDVIKYRTAYSAMEKIQMKLLQEGI